MAKTILPPEIKQYFDFYFLDKPLPKFGDDLERLLKIYIYIETKLLKKAKYNQKWMDKCSKLQREFIEIYERQEKKEKDPKAEEKNKTQEPFYYISGFSKGNEDIFQRLRAKSYDINAKFLKNYEISKI